MKGRNRFTAREIGQLKSHIRKKESAPPAEQKRCRDKMRALGFYISDFKGWGEGFTERDFNRLIEHGIIEVVDQFAPSETFEEAAYPKPQRTFPARRSGHLVSSECTHNTTHEYAQLPALLSDFAKATATPQAERLVPREPGIYAIFIDEAASLPQPFGSILLERGSRLVYVGKAGDDLYGRLIEQDLRHRRPSTFFRGLGAVLGYRPPAGSLRGKKNQSNYKFSATDTRSIIDWIDTHLSVNCVVLAAGTPEQHEPKIIRELTPLLNSKHNPKALRQLAELREECRRIACR